MRDRFGREIDYLRISVTDRCTLRCVYCMPDTAASSCGSRFSDDDILRICTAAAQCGIRRVRLTGGEPLLRPGLPKLIDKIKSDTGIKQTAVTTNGLLLFRYAKALAAAGLDSISVSLDTADEALYKKITRSSFTPHTVHEGIMDAYNTGLRVKLNAVLIKGITLPSLDGLLNYPEQMNIDLRFIELMPIGAGTGLSGESADIIYEEINKQYPLRIAAREPSSGPARYFTSEGLRGRIGFITAISRGFCSSCNRLRITADGYLKPCLCYDSGISLDRITGSTEKIKNALLRAVNEKPERHCFGAATADRRTMNRIGG